ncbi:uncharacterized protein UTRI_03595_B [Ustilago trichophora]|uniref:Uncharacterized protein n=1 Tax=Ustilago trichophora TaxID=86804 RepID=A0A5C3E051_9BASI|nr:uncharacterized protein UTRI_03595_B [Ustilago trichophora]
MGQASFSLTTFGDQLEAWSRTPLHPTFLPVGALALIHAARVSHATRQVAGSHKNRLGVWQGFLLNQILMFGGVVISNMLLGTPSLVLVAWPVVLLYGGVHVVLDVTPLGKVLLELQDIELVGILMDLSFALLDGILRAEGIIDLGVELVRKHPSTEISTSISAALLNSAIIGGGVPLLIDLFKLDSPTGEWGIRTPTWAKDPFSGTNDIISATLLAYVYLGLSSPASAQFPLIGGMMNNFGLDGLGERDIRTFCSLLLGAGLLAEKAVKLAQETPRQKARPISSSKNGSSNGSAKSRKQSSKKQQ